MNQKCRIVLSVSLFLLVCQLRAQVIIPLPTPTMEPMPARDHWIQLPKARGDWTAFACSGDGQTVVGSGWYGYGGVYVSHDFGLTWIPNRQLPSGNDFSVSRDGRRIWMASYNGLYQSSDGGVTWTKNPMTGIEGESLFYGWLSVRASEDNSVIVVRTSEWGFLVVSTNSGGSWDFRTMPPGRIAMSANAKTLVATSFEFPAMYVSHDYGATWNTNNAPWGYWRDVSVSPDGQTIVGLKDFYGLGIHTDQTKMIYVSRDGGATWDGRFIPVTVWDSLVCSTDAKTIMVFPAYNVLTSFYLSNNGGKSWNVQNEGTRGWRFGACSANGKIMYAVNFGIGTYIHLSK